ncbi:uncharacterized protein IUM83_19392 [Phytophthora cinnamomi]|uniref:uncharacterized protein n=1 Tax=Phytophthora cinnamomi TaxID=4785 RepID=UPI00355A902F|nr:hypothetical protein IUM83_19392 [Phytophthora cinnamomi]
MIATSSALALGETCCADCLEQTDPLHTVITYDPLVFDQCSAATGICCYGCFFTHGTLEYQEGITFDSNGSAQGSAGQPFSFAFNEVSRVTYDFLKINQAQTSFVTNKSTEASSTGNIFTICVDEPGTVVFRGWGTDSCTQVTEEYKFSVVEVNSTGTCGSSGSITLVGSASSAHNELVDATGRDTTSSLYTGQEDFTNCNPTRGTVVTQADGSKVCKCTGDWRNPPTCDEFSYVKVVITILGAVATVVSILISVRAYVKSRKSSKAKSSTSKDAEEDSNDDCDDILSVEVIHIGNKPPVGTPGKPSPGIPGSPARPSFIANEQITTSTKETTL